LVETKLKRALPSILEKAENLPTMPDVAAEILRLTEDEEAVGLDEFAPVLQRDPGLSAKLLRVANSAAYNAGNPISTLEQATSLLGIKTLQTMALSFCLVDSLSQHRVAGAFDLQDYWRRSLLGAVAARGLARLTRRSPENEAFLCGLLGEIGRLVLAVCLPRLYDGVLERANGRPSPESEERILGFNHCDVGAALLREWQLPPSVYTSVGYMLRPDELPEPAPQGARDLVEVMHLASLTRDVLAGDERRVALLSLAARARAWGVSHRHLGGYLLGLEQDLAETAELMDMRLPEGPPHAEILRDLREELSDALDGDQKDLLLADRRDTNSPPPLRRPSSPDKIDRLTGLPVREHLSQVLDEEVAKLARRERIRALGLLRMRIDGMPELARKHGADIANDIEKMVGRFLARTCRQSDLPACSGGSEFAVLLAHANVSTLEGMAQRILRQARGLELVRGGQLIQFTLSAGAVCAARCEPGTSGSSLWRVAGLALERASIAGGDRLDVDRELRLRNVG
jgi:diguanylate cyclase (GGDEF)-like protein